MNMLAFDERISPGELAMLASGVKNIPPYERHLMGESFRGNQPPEFYAGLAAGLQLACLLTETEEEPQWVTANEETVFRKSLGVRTLIVTADFILNHADLD
jgi:hypothetical protein